MVNNDRCACLVDFSMITLVPDPATYISTCLEGGTLQWLSPELINSDSFGIQGRRPTPSSVGEEGKLFTDDMWNVVELCWKHQPGKWA